MDEQPSPLANRVAARMTELKISQSEVARRGRFNATFISDLLLGKKRSLRRENYARLAQALVTTELYLRAGATPSSDEIARIAKDLGWDVPETESRDLHPMDEEDLEDIVAALSAPPASARVEGTNLASLPLYRAGSRYDGASVVEKNPVHHITWPAHYQVSNIYAIAIADATMTPRYDPGDVAYALNGGIAHTKDYVAIHLKGRSGRRNLEIALVRQLLFIDRHEVVVRQISPNLETRYPRSSVISINRIIFAGEIISELGFSSR